MKLWLGVSTLLVKMLTARAANSCAVNQQTYQHSAFTHGSELQWKLCVALEGQYDVMVFFLSAKKYD